MGNIKKALGDTKWWSTVIAALVPLFYAFGVSEPTVEGVVAVVTAVASLITYTVCQASVDRKHEETVVTYDEGFDAGYEEGIFALLDGLSIDENGDIAEKRE